MSKKGKKKGAKRLEAQARMHEALYGGDWKEVGEYRRQALAVAGKHGLRLDNGKVTAEAVKLLSRRLEEFAAGKRKLKGEPPFLKVLRTARDCELPDYGNEDEMRSLRMLEALGHIRNGALSGKGRELLRAIELRA